MDSQLNETAPMKTRKDEAAPPNQLILNYDRSRHVSRHVRLVGGLVDRLPHSDTTFSPFHVLPSLRFEPSRLSIRADRATVLLSSASEFRRPPTDAGAEGS